MPDLTPIQAAVLKTFLAVQDHGHFSPEAKAAADVAMDLIFRKHVAADGTEEAVDA